MASIRAHWPPYTTSDSPRIWWCIFFICFFDLFRRPGDLSDAKKKMQTHIICMFCLLPKQCGHTEGVLTVGVKARCLMMPHTTFLDADAGPTSRSLEGAWPMPSHSAPMLHKRAAILQIHLTRERKPLLSSTKNCQPFLAREIIQRCHAVGCPTSKNIQNLAAF